MLTRELWNETPEPRGRAAISVFEPPLMDSSQVEYVTAGPNTRIAYLNAPPVLPRGRWFRNSEVETGGGWASDQNGGTDPSTGISRCSAAQLPTFLREIGRHEGVGRAANSHQGIIDRGDVVFGSAIEGAVAFSSSEASTVRSLRSRVVSDYSYWVSVLNDPRVLALDEEDRVRWYSPAPVGVFPCRWDFTRTDP